MVFGEDANRIHKANAPTRLPILRPLALSLLKQESRLQRRISVKRSKSAWDEHYVSKVLPV